MAVSMQALMDNLKLYKEETDKRLSETFWHLPSEKVAADKHVPPLTVPHTACLFSVGAPGLLPNHLRASRLPDRLHPN